MLKGWEILKLRLRYGALDEGGYRDLLSSTLGSLHGKETRIGPLHHLILEAGIDLRPAVNSPECPPDIMRWRCWLAMAVRYFGALAQKQGAKVRSNTLEEVCERIHPGDKLVQGLRFGDRGTIYSILRQDFDSGALLSDFPQLSCEQDENLEHLCSPVTREDPIVVRQVGNWTTNLQDEWSEELQRRLQVGILVKSAQAMKGLADWLAGVKEDADPDEFREFMEQFQKAGLDWAYGLTVFFDAQLTRRYRQMTSTASWVLIGAILFVLFLAADAISFGLRWAPGILVASVCTILLLGLSLFLVARFFVITFTVRGNVEDQIEALNKIRDRYLTSDPQPDNPSDKKPED